MFQSQYALNFFVYVARNEQYRNAFLDVLYLCKTKTNGINEIELRPKIHQKQQQPTSKECLRYASVTIFHIPSTISKSMLIEYL